MNKTKLIAILMAVALAIIAFVIYNNVVLSWR